MDPDSTNDKDLERNIKKQYSHVMSNASNVLQSFWIRYRTILSYTTNRKFVESQCRFVLYCGLVFWVLYFIAS